MASGAGSKPPLKGVDMRELLNTGALVRLLRPDARAARPGEWGGDAGSGSGAKAKGLGLGDGEGLLRTGDVGQLWMVLIRGGEERFLGRQGTGEAARLTLCSMKAWCRSLRQGHSLMPCCLQGQAH